MKKLKEFKSKLLCYFRKKSVKTILYVLLVFFNIGIVFLGIVLSGDPFYERYYGGDILIELLDKIPSEEDRQHVLPYDVQGNVEILRNGETEVNINLVGNYLYGGGTSFPNFLPDGILLPRRDLSRKDTEAESFWSRPFYLSGIESKVILCNLNDDELFPPMHGDIVEGCKEFIINSEIEMVQDSFGDINYDNLLIWFDENSIEKITDEIEEWDRLYGGTLVIDLEFFREKPRTRLFFLKEGFLDISIPVFIAEYSYSGMKYIADCDYDLNLNPGKLFLTKRKDYYINYNYFEVNPHFEGYIIEPNGFYGQKSYFTTSSSAYENEKQIIEVLFQKTGLQYIPYLSGIIGIEIIIWISDEMNKRNRNKWNRRNKRNRN